MFLFVTKEMSKSSIPQIYQVIPYMDCLNDALDDFAGDGTLFSAVRVTARCGAVVLNKYYGKTDESIIFRIAMSESSTIYCFPY
jgi:hypothetical protein